MKMFNTIDKSEIKKAFDRGRFDKEDHISPKYFTDGMYVRKNRLVISNVMVSVVITGIEFEYAAEYIRGYTGLTV